MEHHPKGKEIVGCDRCHGKNHEKLIMPSYTLCGECHEKAIKRTSGGRTGSHAHAYHLELIDQGCQMEKPAEETTACLACHAIAENRCDGCHTRHRFSTLLRQENPPVAVFAILVLNNMSMRCTCSRITA